ncbi:hypothetical protein KRR26_12675 [Corallococcus sp. M34]|uniref:hypothetical protein n=1 Tax=Citreicoccus inhibens TaxID=2849499 RepID=UPI001C213285|nr:hypothetical protein [Citreicoccus inhibens]MBU8896468.1 hypothetical protein [Citreicoccus inhibens]
MSRPAARRLPGIRFEVQAPPVEEALPRMDVAAFVGFAASGPLHVPVAVEDPADFEAVFGGAPTLARDPVTGEVVMAHLASAVRAFFRNGGRRCWVVRVAGDGAKSNTFPVPGLVRCSESGKVTAAVAHARSEGSWSDDVRVATSLTRELLELGTWSAVGTDVVLEVTVPGGVAPGDLLRLTFGDGSLALLVPVDAAESVDATQTLPMPGLAPRRVTLRVRSPRARWLQTGVGLGALPLFAQWTRGDGQVVTIPVLQVDDPGAASDRRTLTLTLDTSAELAPEPGAVLRVVAAGTGEHWLTVESRVLGQGTGVVQVTGVASRALTAPPLDVSSTPVFCERLTLSLWTRRGDEQPARLDLLGLCPAHPRHWGSLPTDVRRAWDEEPESLPGRLPEVRLPGDWRQGIPVSRFPLAGPGPEGEAFSFPLGMTDVPGGWLGCVPPPSEALVRDGLNDFGSELFLDRDLRDLGTDTLMAQAAFLRYQASQPRAPRGIHSLLWRADVTLVAVPDLVHRPWVREPVATYPPAQAGDTPPQPAWGTFLDCARMAPPAPTALLATPSTPEVGQAFTVQWSAVTGTDLTYVLEEATRRDFRDAVELYRGVDLARTLHGRTAGSWYYRVHAERSGTPGPYAPGVLVSVVPAVHWRLEPVASYSPEPLLAVQRALLRMSCARGDILAVLSVPAHYREDDVIAHAGLLQSPMAGASEGVPALGFAEENALSYGALYHPWTFVSEEQRPDVPLRMPPDGATSGVLARRALERGAWVAPANEPWRAVVALTPPLARERWLDLQDAQVNVVRQEPRAFLTLGADTLAVDSDVRPIHVRRLLSLLRRAALKLGAAYVFEPNDASFHRLVQRGFEALLGDLFVRGAFAGTTREGAFQVVTGDALNTPAQTEQGRFFVDIKVAPSQPLTFLNVRLVQSGDRGLVTEAR